MLGLVLGKRENWETMNRPTYIASCSFGKDSIATILLALENGEPLDRIVFVEVMFDNKRGISGEDPDHIKWVKDVAIPKIEELWGGESMSSATRIMII